MSRPEVTAALHSIRLHFAAHADVAKADGNASQLQGAEELLTAVAVVSEALRAPAEGELARLEDLRKRAAGLAEHFIPDPHTPEEECTDCLMAESIATAIKALPLTEGE